MRSSFNILFIFTLLFFTQCKKETIEKASFGEAFSISYNEKVIIHCEKDTCKQLQITLNSMEDNRCVECFQAGAVTVFLEVNDAAISKQVSLSADYNKLNVPFDSVRVGDNIIQLLKVEPDKTSPKREIKKKKYRVQLLVKKVKI